MIFFCRLPAVFGPLVLWVFLKVQWVDLGCAIMAFTGHAHFLVHSRYKKKSNVALLLLMFFFLLFNAITSDYKRSLFTEKHQ